MLKDVIAVCENGCIKLLWEWADEKVESIRIYYKRSEIAEGDGSIFLDEDVMHIPYNRRGRAERTINGECGLYTFTIIPKMADGSIGEKFLVKDIMLGEIVRVPWSFSTQKDNVTIVFPDFTDKVLAGAACLDNGICRQRLDYELNKDTILFFPFSSINTERIKLCACKPYDMVYCFYKK